MAKMYANPRPDWKINIYICYSVSVPIIPAFRISDNPQGLYIKGNYSQEIADSLFDYCHIRLKGVYIQIK